MPDLAVGADGRVTAIWYLFGLTRVESSTRAGAASPWSGHEKVGAPSGYPSDRPVLAVDSSGTTTATWSRGSGVVANRRTATGNWAPTTTDLSAPVFPDAYAPAVSVAPSGLTLIAWHSVAPGYRSHLQSATHSPSAGWSFGQELGELPELRSRVINAMDEQGNGTWSGPKDAAVRSRTYDVGGPDLLDLSIPSTGVAGQAVAVSVRPRDRWSPVSSTTWDFGCRRPARVSRCKG